MGTSLKQSILDEARRLGFVLAGVTTPDPPPHLSTFESWLAQGRHATMDYLASERSRARRADPRQILPECKSILVLGAPYSPPDPLEAGSTPQDPAGRVAAYAYGDDYHDVLPPRLEALVHFIEQHAGHPVANRWYTDTGPLLERDLAMRAGLGWIGKNTCLIHPRRGSYFLLAEILLDLRLEPDKPFAADHCGSCTRCIDACPTDCILPDRTLDAARCISYLTIELKDDVPPDLRDKMGSWVFGCDICQAVCPWNRFAAEQGDPAFCGDDETQHPRLLREIRSAPREFNSKFKKSPIRRARRRGYLRNVAIAIGNIGSSSTLPTLDQAARDPEPLVQRHAAWAADQIRKRRGASATVPVWRVRSGIIRPKVPMKLLIATNNKGKMEEVQALLAGLNIELLTPEQLGVDLRVTEDGSTYAENAEKKAVAFARIADMISLADDSGLEVEALGGAPGIYSARYTGKAGASDAERRALLLKNLEGKPRPWLARFRAAIAIAVPHGSVQVIEGQCPGEIIPEERGTGGFGYDPIFYIPELGRTMAELDMVEKNRVSHRARAVLKARPILEMLAK